METPTVLTKRQRGLIEKHFDLVKKTRNAFLRRHRPYFGLNEDDLDSAASAGLIYAATSFDPSKGFFKDRATRCMWSRMMDAVRKQARLCRGRVELEDVCSISVSRRDSQRLISVLFSMPARDRAIVYLYFVKGWTWEKIGQLLETNKTTVWHRWQKIREELKIA